ncbi:MarR family winged helix-turn-helix transcriptional regulator [Kitasatospora aureofaciens]|uniref:MarR family winged helix-turn-helix transcriptional regulator n=1 Tax=Kitasatospora aureofaciens TaxID=1894 RepID=UPI001C44FF9B|nr:MarR family transcriptional regulator [Kitasatospora aureofaciens]MBV6701054.1 MarR family transcriptional regulator [Kitasatospora aureofaciens]
MKHDHVDEIITAWRKELPEIAGLPLELSKRTALLTAAFDVLTQEELERLGLTQADYGVLATLRRIGDPYRLTPTDLSQSLLLSSGGTSNVVKRLVEAGYLAREADPKDGRSSFVKLTPEGIRIAEEAVTKVTAAHARLVARIPDQTARLISELLRTALAAVEEGVLIRD